MSIPGWVLTARAVGLTVFHVGFSLHEPEAQTFEILPSESVKRQLLRTGDDGADIARHGVRRQLQPNRNRFWVEAHFFGQVVLRLARNVSSES